MKLKKGIIGRDDGFIVQSLFLIFYFLERVSIFYWIRKIAKIRAEKKKLGKPFVCSYIFPEIWVIANIIFAIGSQALAVRTTNKWILYVLIIYAAERTLEMFVYQVNVLFFHRLINVFMEPKKKEQKKEPEISATTSAPEEGYAIKSSTRMVILLIFNMIEYILQFAVIFAAFGSLQNDPSMHLSLLESFQVFMSLGGLEMYESGVLMTVAYVESIVGIFMNILCLARFVGILPEVREKGYNQSKPQV